MTKNPIEDINTLKKQSISLDLLSIMNENLAKIANGRFSTDFVANHLKNLNSSLNQAPDLNSSQVVSLNDLENLKEKWINLNLIPMKSDSIKDEITTTLESIFEHFKAQKIEDNLLSFFKSDGDFYKNITKVSILSQKSALQEVMIRLCDYMSLVSNQDKDQQTTLLLALPNDEQLNCAGGTSVRLGELIQIIKSSQNNQYFPLQIHNKLKWQFVEETKYDTSKGNQVHVISYLDYFLGIKTAKETVKGDGFYRIDDIIPMPTIFDFYQKYGINFKKILTKELQEKGQESIDDVEFLISILGEEKSINVNEESKEKIKAYTLNFEGNNHNKLVTILKKWNKKEDDYVIQDDNYLSYLAAVKVKELIKEQKEFLNFSWLKLDLQPEKVLPKSIEYFITKEQLFISDIQEKVALLLQSSAEKEFIFGLNIMSIIGGRYIGASKGQYRGVLRYLSQEEEEQIVQKAIALEKENKISERLSKFFQDPNMRFEKIDQTQLLNPCGEEMEFEISKIVRSNFKEVIKNFTARTDYKIFVDKLFGNEKVTEELIQELVFQTVKNNKTKLCQTLIEKLVTFNFSPDRIKEILTLKDEESPLFYAINNNNSALVESFIKAGLDVNQVISGRNDMPLDLAVKNGNPEMVKVLIDNGAIINNSFFSRLDLAVMEGNFQVFKVLLEKSEEKLSPIEFKEFINEGNILTQVAEYGSSEMVRILLDKAEKNLSPEDFTEFFNKEDYYGHTPLCSASRYGEYETIKILLAKGADINQISGSATPLIEAIRSGRIELVKFLLDRGATAVFNSEEMLIATPLNAAIEQDDIGRALELVTILLDKVKKETPAQLKAFVCQVDMYGNASLHIAAKMGNIKITKLLIENEADVNQKESSDHLDANTPLHIAIQHGHSKLAKILLNKGADINAENIHGQTPLSMALDLNNNDDMVEILLKKAAKITTKKPPSNDMTKGGAIRAIRDLRNQNSSKLTKDEFKTFLDKEEKDGETPLHIVAEKNYAKICKAFIKRAKKEFSSEDFNKFINKEANDGKSALHIAVDNGNAELVKLLLDKGANINQINKYGATALFIAVEAGFSKEIIETLLTAKGIDFNKADNDGITPLNIAVTNNRLMAIEALFKKATNKTTSDEQFKIFIDDAIKNPEISSPINYLLRYGYEELALDLINKAKEILTLEELEILVSLPDDNGVKPLDFAFEYSYLKVSKVLTEIEEMSKIAAESQYHASVAPHTKMRIKQMIPSTFDENLPQPPKEAPPSSNPRHQRISNSKPQGEDLSR